MEGEWNMLIQGAKKYKSEMATEGVDYFMV
jgi:hypothetical protein